MSDTVAIQFMPTFYEEYAFHAYSGERWEYGEVKHIPVDAEVRIKINGESVYVNLIDDLLTNRNFRLADSGRNPKLTCAVCSEDAFVEAIIHPFNPKASIPMDIGGKRYCLDCFNKAPKHFLPDSVEMISSEG